MPVYFVQAGEDGPVKIGFAVDVASRLAELQCGNHCELIPLRTIEGGRAVEAWLHRNFREFRIRGEWFRFASGMMEVDPVLRMSAPTEHNRPVSFSSIIEALGGSAALGRIIGKPIGTASAMKTRDVIPPAHWDAVVSGAAEAGLADISHELLSKLYASRRTTTEAA